MKVLGELYMLRAVYVAMLFVLYVVVNNFLCKPLSSLSPPIQKAKTENNSQPRNRVVDAEHLQPDSLIGYYSQFWFFWINDESGLYRKLYTTTYNTNNTCNIQHNHTQYVGRAMGDCMKKHLICLIW